MGLCQGCNLPWGCRLTRWHLNNWEQAGRYRYISSTGLPEPGLFPRFRVITLYKSTQPLGMQPSKSIVSLILLRSCDRPVMTHVCPKDVPSLRRMWLVQVRCAAVPSLFPGMKTRIVPHLNIPIYCIFQPCLVDKELKQKISLDYREHSLMYPFSKSCFCVWAYRPHVGEDYMTKILLFLSFEFYCVCTQYSRKDYFWHYLIGFVKYGFTGMCFICPCI